MPLSPPLQFPGGELGLPCAEPFPLPGKKATPPAPTAPVALELWFLAATAVLEDQGGEMGDLGDEEDPGEVMLI